MIQEYDAAVFFTIDLKAFQPARSEYRKVVFIPPAIDPVSTKNMDLP